MSNEQALLFLPDISGFTQFVDNTEIDHSHHIISELIEIIIDEDELGLTVAEVEGDAVFFYSAGPKPSVEALLEQCRRMFLRFHQHLLRYAKERICECGACRTAERLTLKFVAHAGAIRMITAGGRSKPFGSDVIIAHRLLKNDVVGHEYILLTDALVQEKPLPALEGMRSMEGGTGNYEDMNPVRYQVVDISGLHPYVKAVEVPAADLPESSHPIRNKITIDAPPEFVYRVLTDLDRRGEWDDLAQRIDRPDSHVNRPGSRHTCVLPIGSMEIETVSGKRTEAGIVYVERLLSVPFIPTAYLRYRLEPDGRGTVVKAALHLVPRSFLGRVMLLFARKRLGRWSSVSLQNLSTIFEKEGSGAPRTADPNRSQNIKTIATP